MTINSLRDVSQMYDAIAAYSVMNKIVGDSEWWEGFLEGNTALSERGQEKLMQFYQIANR